MGNVMKDSICLSFVVESITERLIYPTHVSSSAIFPDIVVTDTSLRNLVTDQLITIRGRHWPLGSKIDFTILQVRIPETCTKHRFNHTAVIEGPHEERINFRTK